MWRVVSRMHSLARPSFKHQLDTTARIGSKVFTAVEELKKAIDGDEDAPKGGYDLAMYRCATIVSNIVEGINSRVLHLHTESNFVKFFEETKSLSIDGATDVEESVEAAKQTGRYQNLSLINYNRPYYDEYRPSSYEFVVSTPPLSRTTIGAPLPEIIRVLNQRGYGIVGATKPVWENYRIRAEIEKLHGEKKIRFLSLQTIPCEVEPNSGISMDYSIVVFRKL